MSKRTMTKELGLPKYTFNNEIKRGMLKQPNIRDGKEVFEYSAHKAQDYIDTGAANKGSRMRMTNIIAQKINVKICKFPKIYYTHAHAHGKKDSWRMPTAVSSSAL